jgi:hypothetical protein
MRKILLGVTALALLIGPAVAEQGKTTKQQATQKADKGPNAVFCEGKYIGSDPDPAVRLQMLKDYNCPDQGH